MTAFQFINGEGAMAVHQFSLQDPSSLLPFAVLHLCVLLDEAIDSGFNVDAFTNGTRVVLLWMLSRPKKASSLLTRKAETYQWIMPERNPPLAAGFSKCEKEGLLPSNSNANSKSRKQSVPNLITSHL